MNYILFDDWRRMDLLPLTFARPVADIRAGITTIREKWENFLQVKTSSLTEKYLSRKFPLITEAENILINGAVIPNEELVRMIVNMKPGQILVKDDYIVAQHITEDELKKTGKSNAAETAEIQLEIPFIRLNNTWEVFTLNDELMRQDFIRLTKGRKSAKASATNHIIGEENLFIEEGAVMEFSSVNASTGPVYIGRNTEIMEGSLIRGPFALLDHSVVKMGTRIYGATTVGPHSKVGGELNNVVIFGYTNKVHDGFLGNSVIGEWCNIGAGTSSSNLKNTYEQVKIWSYSYESFINTGLQFCGLIMGDHCKTGINTMFNTGTVVGVFANIFGAGFMRNFIPSFTWGGPSGFKTYDINKAMETASSVYARRNLDFDDIEEKLLREIYNITFAYRDI
jgi:UDP-N-acetylglucosamine diphosphorylase/glucosamine-1-phosphate N-acetyltransferase